jgi:hypothetical protein
MITTLEIYHAYAEGDPNQLMIINALKNKDIAVVLLYISRLLSGWSAGKYDKSMLNAKSMIYKTHRDFCSSKWRLYLT